MKIIKLTTQETCEDGRHFHYAIPINKILSVKGVHGGENTYCEVNGVYVKESYNDVIKKIEEESDEINRKTKGTN